MHGWSVSLALLAALAQSAAAVLALRLGRWTRGHRGWWLLGTAFGLLAIRRGYAAYRTITTEAGLPEGEAYAALVAICSLLAVLALGNPLRQGHRDAGYRAEQEQQVHLQKELDRLQELQGAILRCGAFGALLLEQGRITWASDGFHQLLGLDASTCVGRRFEDLFPEPGQGDRTLASALESLPQGGTFRREVMLQGSGGTPLNCRMTLQPVEADQPERGLVCIVEDLSDIRAALAREAELHRFLETVIDTADVWINTLDTDARIVIWNRAAEEISGYSKAEVIGRAEIWRGLYPDPDYLSAVAAKAGAILSEDQVARDFQTTIRTKDGRDRIMSWDSRALRDEQGRISGSLAIGRDITEIKGTERELERVHFVQNLMLQHSALGIAYVRQRQFDWVNPRLAEILGTSSDQLVGRSTRLLYLSDASYEAAGRESYQQMERGRTADFRAQVRRWNGSPIWCRFVGKALDSSKPQEGSIWVLEDIQERVASEVALAESEARFRGIFEGTQDALLLLTRTTIFDCNHRSLEVFGFQQKSEFLSRHPVDLSSPRQADGEAAQPLWERHLQTALLEGSELFPWEFRTQRGERFHAQVLVSAFSMGTRKVFQASVRRQGRS